MDDKQIFAALEIANHEVRLIVGEFFNTRFNIIKVERIPCSALAFNEVVNRTALIEAIQKAVEDTRKMIGARIEKVIIGMPSYNMYRYPVKSTVKIEGIDGVITIEDVKRAIKKTQAVNVHKKYALIQTLCVKYTVNGISSRRIPIGEHAEELTVDIDLLCADRKLSFDIVGCVEAAGLQVLDIYLDIYGVAKEAALFEQAVDQNVIVLKMERNSTTLGLVARGRLNSCVVLPDGVGGMASSVVEEYGLNTTAAAELVKYSAVLNGNSYSDNPVYIWEDHGETKRISERDLCNCIMPKVQSWIDSIRNLCTPILKAGRTTVIITGEGGEMQGLNALLQNQLNCEVRNYVPETLGGRNAGLSACLGLFYAYKDQLPITGYVDRSLDMDAFIKSVSFREVKNTPNNEDTFTSKLRSLFETKK